MIKSELGKVYADGEIICREDEDAKVMYVIEDGKLNIIGKQNNSPKSTILIMCQRTK